MLQFSLRPAAALVLMCLSPLFAAAQGVFINEIHYDNASTDVDEFFEIAGPAGTDLSGWSVVLYNGSNGLAYNTINLSGVLADQGAGYGTSSTTLPTNGIQNGSPDGLALVDDGGTVIEFLSYEGSFAAADGPATGLTSTDIGVEEPFDLPVGQSLQVTGCPKDGFGWSGPAAQSPGAINTGQTFDPAAECGGPPRPPANVFLTELHYDNEGGDTGEFLEVTGPAGADLAGWSIALYNGNGGALYDTVALSGTLPDQAGSGFGALSFSRTGIQNGSPDGLALVDAGGAVVEFLSYGGSFTAVGGPADGLTSTDIGASEASSTPIGQSLQLTGCQLGGFSWVGPLPQSPGSVNAGLTYDPTYDCSLPLLSICTIQGAGHISPFEGDLVRTKGVVTALASNGYYVQDEGCDSDPATSDGIFVFDTRGLVAVGDEIEMIDVVSEFIPGGASTRNLSTTELTFPQLSILSTGNTLPAPVVLGEGGRIPPAVIVNSEVGDVSSGALTFNPDVDGIDFYESVEGMLVLIPDSVAVSPVNRFGEVWVLSNQGANVAPADARTARGGISLQPDLNNQGDQNPERIQIQLPNGGPAVNLGDVLADVTGVVSYNFGNFEVVPAHDVLIAQASGIQAEVTEFIGDKHKLTIAGYNILNHAATSDDDVQRGILAAHIAQNLGGPDIIALQEIQDNNGETNDGTTDASLTLQRLAEAIAAAGGPGYLGIDVPPVDNSQGGVPGGNIRVAYLYNPARVQLLDFYALTPQVLMSMDVTDTAAFDGSRIPLLAEFKFRGQKVTVINNHFSSRSGSSPIFGATQPFVQGAEDVREAQARAINEVVDFLIPGNEGAKNIVVLGDFNTFEFTNDLAELLPGVSGEQVLTNLIPTLTDDNVYSFIFEGNSQVLDHLFVSRSLERRAELDIVHVNTDFAQPSGVIVGSDHEPLLLRLNFASENQ